MFKISKCLDCGNELEISYECCKDIDSNPIETEDDLNKKIKLIEELTNFNVIKNICINCLEKLIHEREENNNIIQKEKEQIVINLDMLNNEVESEEFKKILGTNEEDIINEEIRSTEKLKFLLEKEKSLQNELSRLLEDFKSLSDDEKKFWDDYSNLETNIHLYESFKSNIKNKMCNMEKEIKTFSNKNIFNELFNITFTEKYGLINGCRIGMIWPIDTNMEIDEINSGWGLIIHLTIVISNKFNFESNKYDLYPMGSFSKIMSKDSKIVGELIYSPNKPIERLNEAIVMYLEYIQEMNEFLIKKRFITSKTYFFNFVIKEDSINDFCIKYDSNNIEGCAQGMKYLLVILKSYIDAALKLEHDLFKDIVERSAIINNK